MVGGRRRISPQPTEITARRGLVPSQRILISMVCRFWCVACRKSHFIVGRGCDDDVEKDPCLELGDKNCDELRELEAAGLVIVSPGAEAT